MISMLNSVVMVDQIISHTDEAGVQAQTKPKNSLHDYLMLTASRISPIEDWAE